MRWSVASAERSASSVSNGTEAPAAAATCGGALSEICSERSVATVSDRASADNLAAGRLDPQLRAAQGQAHTAALAADWRISDPAAELRFVHTSLALMPGFGGLGRLERLVGPSTALRLLATRARVGAEEAERLGLIEAIVPAAEQLAWATALAEQMRDSDRYALAEIKAALRDGDERSAFLRVWPHRQLPDRLGS
jgi:hypothetical protein